MNPNLHTAVASTSVPPPPPCSGISGSLACGGRSEPQHLAHCFRGSWSALELSGPSPSPPWSLPPGDSGPPTLIGGSSCLGWSRGRVSKQGGPMGPWVCGRKELTSKGVTLLLYQNRALDQTLVKMPVPWAGLAPCPLPPQQTPEPAYPTSPAFPPLSCPFASRVVYQDGFYGAEIYVSAAPGEGG